MRKGPESSSVEAWEKGMRGVRSAAKSRMAEPAKRAEETKSVRAGHNCHVTVGNGIGSGSRRSRPQPPRRREKNQSAGGMRPRIGRSAFAMRLMHGGVASSTIELEICCFHRQDLRRTGHHPERDSNVQQIGSRRRGRWISLVSGAVRCAIAHIAARIVGPPSSPGRRPGSAPPASEARTW